ncbi:MAG: hypothetical protein JWL59_3318 [Chthoniobacteraceae bacterium]|nr:hypothetical protein [Chthoniobacteraceae bacterium]
MKNDSIGEASESNTQDEAGTVEWIYFHPYISRPGESAGAWSRSSEKNGEDLSDMESSS